MACPEFGISTHSGTAVSHQLREISPIKGCKSKLLLVRTTVVGIFRLTSSGLLAPGRCNDHASICGKVLLICRAVGSYPSAGLPTMVLGKRPDRLRVLAVIVANSKIKTEIILVN